MVLKLIASIITTLICFHYEIQAGSCELTIARLKYGGGGDWYANPSALPNLVKAVKTRTDISICDSVATIEIGNQQFFHFPFIYMTGHGDVHLTNQEKIRLRKYLIGGGFLWADDNYGLDKSFRKEITALFPENQLTELPSGHPVYKSFYKLSGLPKIHEHDGLPAQAFGVFFGGGNGHFYKLMEVKGVGKELLTLP
jgi:hypothetical protein